MRDLRALRHTDKRYIYKQIHTRGYCEWKTLKGCEKLDIKHADNMTDIRTQLKNIGLAINNNDEYLEFFKEFKMTTVFEIQTTRYTISIRTNGYKSITMETPNYSKTIESRVSSFKFELVHCPDCYKLSISEPISKDTCHLVDYVTIPRNE